jgi:hypothetical protein
VRLLAPLDLVEELGPDPHRTATRMANRASRRASTSPLMNEVKHDLDRPGDLGGFLRGAFDFIFTGDNPSLMSALSTVNVSPETSEEIVDRIEEQFGDFGEMPKHLDSIRAALEAASLADFERARDDALAVYRGLLEVLDVLAQLVGVTPDDDADSGKVDAMDLVPVFLVMRRQMGDEEMGALLTAFGDPMTLFQPVAAAFQTWAEERPEDAAVLRPLGLAAIKRALS